MSISERSRREQILTDQGDIYQRYHARRKRYSHIFESPNTLNAEGTFERILREAVPGKRILEIGCGNGQYALRVSQLGASYVLATDISHNRIAQARQHEIPGVLDFQIADVAQPIEGVYDVIMGRAVLHHLDYQEVLLRLARENLRESGLMLFYEPLGSNLLMRLYQARSQDAHTPDEHPFERSDLAWLRATFADFTLLPINYFSLSAGAISSFLFKKPDNVLLRMADHIDNFLARRASWLHPRFRAAIFVIRKP
jgi:2-polyprenyl-3-methyl-5-hydroxy-6-metoxy-1,4-benzoquinol methylase